MTTAYIATNTTHVPTVLGLCGISHLMFMTGGVYSFKQTRIVPIVEKKTDP